MARKTECPSCLAQATKVTSTRYTKKMRLVKRYCTCLECNETFVTVEIGMSAYQTLLSQAALLNTVVGALLTESGKQAMLHLPIFKRLIKIVKGPNPK